MSFQSILFPKFHDPILDEALDVPEFFEDLGLNKIVEAIAALRPGYNLAPFFQSRLVNPESIAYRQEIMHDFEDPKLRQIVGSFSQQMLNHREHLRQSEKLHYKYEKARRFLSAVEGYYRCVLQLSEQLSGYKLKSEGLSHFCEYLAEYIKSDRFMNLARDGDKLKSDFTAIRYRVQIDGRRVTVHPGNGEAKHTPIIEDAFAKFRQGAVKEYRFDLPTWEFMNHIEARVLDEVASLHPDCFHRLEAFCAIHAAYLDETIGRFHREAQFYLAYLEYIAPLRELGLEFCYPEISTTDKGVSASRAFDLALAQKLLQDHKTVICNDFYLQNKERIFVVSGPNQGGKTIFARMFGQLHYLGCLGCLVPGARAKFFLFDHIFSHFEKQEEIKNFRGKLQDDLVRIRRILDRATPNSLIILNEIFSSTSLKDAIYLSQKIITIISDLDLICVWVTFVDDLALPYDKAVSMVGMVEASNPTIRSYHIKRLPASGLAYAVAIAERHRVTYDHLKTRITP